MFYTIFKSKLHLLHIKRSVYFFKSSINHEFKMIEEFKFNYCSQETDYQRPLFRQCGPQAMYLCFYYIQYNSIYISNCPIQYTIILFERMYIILLWQIHVHIRRKICAYFFYFLDLVLCVKTGNVIFQNKIPSPQCCVFQSTFCWYLPYLPVHTTELPDARVTRQKKFSYKEEQ